MFFSDPRKESLLASSVAALPGDPHGILPSSHASLPRPLWHVNPRSAGERLIFQPHGLVIQVLELQLRALNDGFPLPISQSAGGRAATRHGARSKYKPPCYTYRGAILIRIRGTAN